MALREIIKIGHPTLSMKAETVERIDEEIVRLAQDMVETLHAAPGIGLAAPQVDVLKKLIVVDLSVGQNPDDLIVLVNPEVVDHEGEDISEEGCLSIPGIREKVKRPRRAIVRGLNLEGDEVEIEGEDLLARALCHEIDHLSGKLFIEYLSPLKRSFIRKKLKKNEEAGQSP
jgi:peptide deformylase